MRLLRQLFQTLMFCLAVLLPTLCAAAYVIADGYDVPLVGSAIRFARPWAGLLGLSCVLVLLSRVFWDKARAPRVKASRGNDLSALPMSVRVRLRPVLPALRTVALLLLVVALMRPFLAAHL